MNASLLISALTTAVSIGLGCGACCSPIISTFLSTYVISHANGVKKGLLSFVSFFFGKLLGVSSLCIVSAFISRRFISEDGYIGSFHLRLFSQTAMSLIGVIMVIRWIMELNRERKCRGCKSCGKQEGKAGVIPMLMAGFAYGITPCAPLLLMIGYCLAIPVPLAGLTGVTFGLSSMVSPILLLTVVTGAFSKKMKKEIPETVKWFRLASYVLLMALPFVVNV